MRGIIHLWPWTLTVLSSMPPRRPASRNAAANARARSERRGAKPRARARATSAAGRPGAGKPNPLAVTAAFRQFVLDQLEEVDDVTARWMFGGVGLYCSGVFFGIIAGDVLYLKVDDTTRPDYERAGMGPFNPYPGRGGTMQYYAVPLAVLESGADLVQWARRAVKVATRMPAARKSGANRRR
jgi:DNA transformation protein and related proteins